VQVDTYVHDSRERTPEKNLRNDPERADTII
jgi:hypothetical protein